MQRTSSFQTFLEQISDINLDEINDLYETITTGLDYGSFKYTEEGEWIVIENKNSDYALILSTETAKEAFLKQLDTDWGGAMKDVLALWESKRQSDKDD